MMPKCPVCKTEYGAHLICPECKFSELSPEFLNERDAIDWESKVVEPWRRKYWDTLLDFQIKGSTLCKYLGKQPVVRVPHGITEIGMSCFNNNDYVQEAVLPQSLHTIKSFAFSGCTALVKIRFPACLSIIEAHAFSFTDALSCVVAPENIHHIGTAAFASRFDPERTVRVFFEGSRDAVNPWGEYCHRWGDGWDADVVLYARGEWHYDETGAPVPNEKS